MEMLEKLDKFIDKFSKKSDEQNEQTVESSGSSTNSIDKEFMETLANAISERYNDDFYFSIIKPVIKQLIVFRDDTAKGLGYLKEMLEEKENENVKEQGNENKNENKNEKTNSATDYSVQILDDVISGIDDMLLSYDVFPYHCEGAGTTFDPKRQRVVKTIPTTIPEQIKTVKESRSSGYERRGIIISKELVYAYAKQTNVDEQRSDG